MRKRIGDRLRQAREARGLSQGDVAARLGLHQTTVGKWELGDNDPGMLQLIALCNVYEVTPDYVLCWTDNAAARALRRGATYYVDHDAVAAVRQAKRRDDVRPLLEFRARLGAEVLANWTEVSREEYEAIERDAQQVFDRLGVDVQDWVKARRRK